MSRQKKAVSKKGSNGGNLGFEEKLWWIADTYHAWRGEKEAGKYKDIPGFCKNSTTEEINQEVAGLRSQIVTSNRGCC